MTQKTRKIAVLTGDIVGSTVLGTAKLERAMAALAECAEVQADWHGESLRFTRNRGDGWQVVLARSEMAVRSALAFRAALRAEGDEFDSYFAIAVDNAPEHLVNNLNTETSLAFVKSGELLDVMKRVEGKKIRMGCLGSNQIAAVVVLADHISQDWTPPQATAMLAMLDPNQKTTFTSLAKTLGKSRQAVTKSLDAAGHMPISLALANIEGAGDTDV